MNMYIIPMRAEVSPGRRQPITGPFDGIRVIDLTSMISGPLATIMLGRQGADVIKVEAPDGGHTRVGANQRGGMSASFLNNKRFVLLDLKAEGPRGRGGRRRDDASSDGAGRVLGELSTRRRRLYQRWGVPSACVRPSCDTTHVQSYSPGEGRLPGPMMAGDLKGVRTSAVKIRGGLLDGDHHRC